MNGPVIVAIDGPAGAGKSTVARSIANKLGVVYIDSGAMYRCVALLGLRASLDPSQSNALEELAREARIDFVAGYNLVMLNGEDVTDAIRESDVTEAASQVAAIPGVRRALVEQQRRIAAGQSVVMEGRDIGTVVFPDAQVKVFLDAQPTVRATRRALELEAKGKPADRETLEREIVQRDHRDRSRTESPLVQASDATYLDTTGLSQADVEEAILKIVRKRFSNGKGMAAH